MRRLWLVLLLASGPAAAAPMLEISEPENAALANEQLSDAGQEAQAMELMEGLRCIQCQGQSIADSDAPIAAAMRNEVRERIQKGETPASIRDWMIKRYGQWVSFDPPMSWATGLLWFAPWLLLIAALWLARGLFRKDAP
jgi:cytochrome c-type biogenesis protein CcmH